MCPKCPGQKVLRCRQVVQVRLLSITPIRASNSPLGTGSSPLYVSLLVTSTTDLRRISSGPMSPNCRPVMRATGALYASWLYMLMGTCAYTPRMSLLHARRLTLPTDQRRHGLYFPEDLLFPFRGRRMSSGVEQLDAQSQHRHSQQSQGQKCAEPQSDEHQTYASQRQ